MTMDDLLFQKSSDPRNAKGISPLLECNNESAELYSV